MKGSSLVLTVLGVSLLISGCASKDEVNPPVVFPEETRYLIVNNVYPSQGFPSGSIATYTSPGEKLIEDAYTVKTQGAVSDVVTDAVVFGEKLYVARSSTPVVDIVNLGSMLVEGSLRYARNASVNTYKHLAITDTRIIVSDRSFVNPTGFDNESFLKVIHLDNPAQVDSIPVIFNAAIYAVTVVRNKIFVSAGGGPQNALTVFDAGTNAKLTTINPGGPCSEMHVDKDGNVLAFTNTKMIKVNTTNLTVTGEKAIYPAQLNLNLFNNFTTCNTAISLDEDNNMLYYLSPAAQPSPAPYILNSYNLTTDVNTVLLTTFISAQTVSFDQKNKLILLGDSKSGLNQRASGLVRRLETTGATSSQLELTNVPSKIIVRE